MDSTQGPDKHTHKCHVRVNGSGRFGGVFNQHSCTKPAKFRRLVGLADVLPSRRTGAFEMFDKIEYRWFCSIHDPVQIRERQDKKYAERVAEYGRKRAREAVKATRQPLVDAVVGKLTNEQLIWLAPRLEFMMLTYQEDCKVRAESLPPW